jgi:pre-rRNA-processing protein TSR2
MAKAENLRLTIIESFMPQPKWSLDQLEDYLILYMEDEFSTLLEDDSEREVARLICALFEQCIQGDFTLSRQLVSNSGAVKSEKVVIQVEGELDDDNYDDMEISGDSHTTDDTAMEIHTAKNYAASLLFGSSSTTTRNEKKNIPPPRQLGEPAVDTSSIEMDDDGFAPISYKKKGR